MTWMAYSGNIGTPHQLPPKQSTWGPLKGPQSRKWRILETWRGCLASLGADSLFRVDARYQTGWLSGWLRAEERQLFWSNQNTSVATLMTWMAYSGNIGTPHQLPPKQSTWGPLKGPQSRKWRILETWRGCLASLLALSLTWDILKCLYVALDKLDCLYVSLVSGTACTTGMERDRVWGTKLGRGRRARAGPQARRGTPSRTSASFKRIFISMRNHLYRTKSWTWTKYWQNLLFVTSS